MSKESIELSQYEDVLSHLKDWAEKAAAMKESSRPEDSACGLHGRDLARSSTIISGLTGAENLLRAIYLDVKEMCA